MQTHLIEKRDIINLEVEKYTEPLHQYTSDWNLLEPNFQEHAILVSGVQPPVLVHLFSESQVEPSGGEWEKRVEDRWDLADGENKYPVFDHNLILENFPNKYLMVPGS